MDIRIGRDEALEWLARAPLHELGQEAFSIKRARYGNRITFIRNRHVNPTNLCEKACRFCAFSARPGDPHAYSLDESRILEDLADASLREAHIVGGLHPQWGFRRSMRLIELIREARPDLWIKAFTAVEVAFFAQLEGHNDWERILGTMREAGVNQMPGGGAEVLNERVHQSLCKDKIGPAQWLEIHRLAHRIGLPSNASLLFGHIERDEEIVDHLLKLRELEDDAPGFQSFVPLAFQRKSGDGTKRSDEGRKPERYPDFHPRPVSAPRALRIVALGRLVLDNIPHIKAYWPSLHLETAAAALNFGADDLDGTLGLERVMHDSGSGMPQRITREDMEQMAKDAGQYLVERDGAFGIVETGNMTGVES